MFQETYEMSVSVPGQSGQFVGKVSAWDADVTNQNSLSYSVRQKTGSLALHMDPETGMWEFGSHANYCSRRKCPRFRQCSRNFRCNLSPLLLGFSALSNHEITARHSISLKQVFFCDCQQ